ncbi:MAG: universal stress protein [Natronomonas sp.]
MTIVACVDRSKDSSEVMIEAARLGEAFGEPVHVVHVLSREAFLSLQRTNVSDTGKAVPVKRVKEIATEIAAEAIGKADIEAEAVGLVGEPAEEIVNYADNHDVSYVIVGGKRRSAVGKAIFGSVAQSVLTESHQPVVVVRRPE